MNITQHFSKLASEAAEKGADASQLLTQRDRLFKDKVVPALVKRNANEAAIAEARSKWNSQTDQVMQSAGLLPKPGQSSKSFAKDKRAEKAVNEAAKTGSKMPIIKETIKSTGETIGNLFGQGVGSTIEGAAGFVRDIGENEKGSVAARLADYGKNLREEYEGSASTYQKDLQAGKSGKASQLAAGAIQSIPAMAFPFGAAKGVATVASKIPAIAGKSAYIGMGAGVAAGHTQNYGEVRRSATQNLERDFPTWEKLQGNPLFEQNFNKYLDSGVSIDKARQQAHAETLDTLSEEAANKYGGMMTALDFVAPSGAVLGSGILKNAPTSKIGKTLVGGGVDSALVKREMTQVPRTGMAKLIPDVSLPANKAAAKMVGKQALEEGLQGGIGNYGGQAASANIGGQAVDWGEVAQSGIEEALIGGVMGGGMQSATGGSPTAQAKDAAKQLRNQTNQLRQEEAKARKELAEAMQLNDPAAVQSAQSNLDNIGAEAVKVKSAYDQYGIDTPYFVERFAAQYQPKQQAEQQVDPEVPPTPEAEQPPAQQALPAPKLTNIITDDTTTIIKDAVSKGNLSEEEAQQIESNPMRSEVFRLAASGEVDAAFNIVENSLALGRIENDYAQALMQDIPRYRDVQKKPTVSSIVNNHVKQQIQSGTDDLFANATELHPDTLDPLQGAESGITNFGYQPDPQQGIIAEDPNLSDFDEGPVSIDSLSTENPPEVLEPVQPLPADPVQPVSKQPDLNKPKTFTNYIRANDYLKSNGLQDSHEIVRGEDGIATVQPKSPVPEADANSDEAFDDLLNAVPPIGTPAQNPVEPVQATDPATDFDSDEAFDEVLNAVPPSKEKAAPVEPVQPTASFADQIREAHLNNPNAKPQLIDDEIAKGRSRADVLKEVGDIVKNIGKAPEPVAPELEATAPDAATPVQPEPVEPTFEEKKESQKQEYLQKVRDAYAKDPASVNDVINKEVPIIGTSTDRLLNIAEAKGIVANLGKQQNPEIEQKTDENGIQENNAPGTMKPGDIGRGSDGKPYLSRNAALRGLKNNNVKDTHEIVELAPSKFVLRAKAEAPAPQETGSSFQKYDEAANQYHYGVNENGVIYKLNGQETAYTVKEKGGRLRVEDIQNNLIFSGPATPKTLEDFFESYWYEKKKPAAQKEKSEKELTPEKVFKALEDLGWKKHGPTLSHADVLPQHKVNVFEKEIVLKDKDEKGIIVNFSDIKDINQYAKEYTAEAKKAKRDLEFEKNEKERKEREQKRKAHSDQHNAIIAAIADYVGKHDYLKGSTEADRGRLSIKGKRYDLGHRNGYWALIDNDLNDHKIDFSNEALSIEQSVGKSLKALFAKHYGHEAFKADTTDYDALSRQSNAAETVQEEAAPVQEETPEPAKKKKEPLTFEKFYNMRKDESQVKAINKILKPLVAEHKDVVSYYTSDEETFLSFKNGNEQDKWRLLKNGQEWVFIQDKNNSAPISEGIVTESVDKAVEAAFAYMLNRYKHPVNVHEFGLVLDEQGNVLNFETLEAAEQFIQDKQINTGFFYATKVGQTYEIHTSRYNAEGRYKSNDPRINSKFEIKNLSEAEPEKASLEFPLAKVKEAYGHAHLSPGNTAKSFKENFDKFIQAEIDEAQPLATTDEQKAALNEAIDWVKDNYINKALPPLLDAASATVSSARAGRNNFNSKQANQRGSALDKATDQFNAELERLKGYAKLKVLAARTPKQKQADAEAAAKAEQEKLEAEQAKQEAKIKAEQEAKANKKRASNANLGNPEGAEQMTAAEWRAKHKDSKSVIDGVRYVMKLVNGATSLVPVWITDEKGTAASTSKDPLQVGNTLTFSQDFDYATANKPYTIITSSKAKLTIEHEGGRLSIDRKILDIESAKNPDLYQVEVNQPAPKTKEETPAANSYESVKQSFDDVVSRLDDGDESLTLDDVKAAYKALMDNHDSLVAELSSQTKSQLLEKMHPYYAAMYKSHKKDELVNKWVNNTYRGMDFGSNGIVTISYGDKRTMAEIVRDKIEAATQEDLNKYLEERRQAVAERQKELEAAEAGMNDPKTLDDFRRINAKGDFKDFKEFYRSLTVPQQALYDELRSAETNEARMQEIERNKAYREASRPSQAVESTTEATLFAGKHTKKGTDIWTVALNGRVDGDAFNDYRSQAKGLGGYYSSYKGGGAVPGFIFDNEAAANEFLNLVTGDHEANSTNPEPEAIAIDPEAEVEVIETDAKRQADKLREKAQAIIERGEQNINRERKTNTAKRAGEAARAEEQANKAIFLGETLNRIADGIENGSVKYLARLGAMTQLSHLESLLQRASYDQQRETNSKEREINATTVAYAEYPQYKTWIDSFKDIRRDLKEANPRLAEKLEKAIDTRYHNAYIRWLNETNEFGTENYVGQLARKTDGTPAVFKTNIKQAETLVKTANKKAGKDSFEVFKIKNGEYAVISSYAAAIENESWKPTNSDKQMTLTNEFGHELYDALKKYKRKNPSYYMNWFIESMHESVSRMEKLGIHDPATFRAAMREYLGLRSKEKGNDPIKELERSMIGRSNDGLDFFPTPRNVVEQMIEMADLDSDMKVLEPSAGMGHIADVLKDHGIQPDVIELSGKRQELLKLKGYSVVGNDFLMFDPKNRAPNYGDVFKTADGKYQGIMRGSGSLGSNRVRLMREDNGQMITYFDREELELVKMNGVNYDRIIMNPPFSDRRDAAHIYHAFDLLADDGVMVAIAGEGVFFGKDKAAKEFQEWLDKVGAEITPLDAGTFNDPSLPVTTGVKARIIKISKADSKGKLFSRSENLNQAPEHTQDTPTGSTPDQVRAELVKRFGQDTIKRLEESGVLSIEPTYAEPGIEGFAENGRVTLIADAITPENIVPVFLHELGGHIGLQGVMKPAAYAVLMKEFNRLVKSGDPAALKAKDLAERESDAEVQQDEYLPYLITVAAQNQAKQGPAQKLINRVISAIKAWAVDKLGLDLKLNANDILALAERMIKKVPEHTPPTGPKGGRRYSKSSTANPQNMSKSKQREFLDAAAQTAFGQMSLRGAEGAKTLSNRGLKLFQTMLHKALQDKTGQFKKTFDLVQGKINHVTFASSKSMDVAPSILTQLEEGSDYIKEVKRVGRTLGHTLSGGKIDKAKVDKDLAKVGQLMFENTLMDNSERHTDKELRQLGFDEDQIKLYNEIRDAIDTSLDTFANTTFSNIYKHLGGTHEEVLELAGRDLDITDHYNEILKKIDALTKGKPEKAEARQAAIEAIDRVYKKANDLKDQGYVPLMRFGKYFVRIWNPTTGEVAYRQHFESESERNIFYRNYDKANIPAGFEIEQGQINELQHKLFQGVSPETVALFAKESGLPIGDAETAYIKYAVQNNHALKRLLKRQGIDGFDQDIKRVLASFVMSNARYSANQTYNPAIDESITNIKDPAYQEDAIRLRDYSLDTQEELAAVKNFAFVWYMGFSAMFGVVNLTQPLLQTFPYLMQYSKDHGTIWNAFKQAVKTWRKGTDAMDPKYKAHYERARKEGHLDPQNTWMMQGLERGKSGLGASTWQLVSHASGLFAQASETVNRRTSLFAALDVAESMGQAKLEKLGFKDAYDFAIRTIQETQGIYNKGNRPRVSRGNIGSLLMMYKQFMIAYIEQMVRMQKSGLYGGEDDEFKKKMAGLVGFGVSRSVLTMLGILMAFSGTSGLPFMRDILDGIETAGGLIGKPVNTEREIQIALHDALGHEVGQAVNTALMDGILNLNPFVDVKGRMGMGDLIPATAYFSPTTSEYMKSSEISQVAGPIGGLVEKVKESVALAQIGAYGQAGVQLLPKAVTSMGQGAIAATTGDYRNMKTGVKTNDATILDGIIKTLDAQPASIAKEGRVRGYEMKDKATQDYINKRWKERYNEALESGNRDQLRDVKQQIRDYNKDNPRYPIKFNQKTAETNFNKSNQSWQEKRKTVKGLEWMSDYNPHLDEE